MRTAIVLLLLVGCPGIRRPIEAPRADLQVTRDAGTVKLALTITNPNDTALELRAIDWELQLDERPIRRGRIELTQTIAAKASAPAQASFAAPPLDDGEVYVRGVAHFESARGDVAADFGAVSPPASGP